jgi:hypothetical protein
MSTPETDPETLPAVRPSRVPVPVPRTLDEQLAFGGMVVKSGLAPAHFKSAEAIVIAVQFGAELGLLPLQSLRLCKVINGIPTLNADGIVGIVLGSGKAEYFLPEDVDSEHATFVTKRKGAPKEVRYTFTIAQATQAGLVQKNPTYKQYPERMLSARAKSFLARDVYPDVVGGMQSEEELADLEPTAPARPPIPLPQRMGEAVRGAGDAPAPPPPPDPPAPTANGQGATEPAAPGERTGLPGVPTPEVLPPTEPTITEKERQELYQACARGGKRQAELKAWLASQGCQSAMAIPRQLFAPAKAWAEGRTARAPGQEG